MSVNLKIKQTIDSLFLVPGLATENSIVICFDGGRVSQEEELNNRRCKNHNTPVEWAIYDTYVAKVMEYASEKLPNVTFWRREFRGCLRKTLEECMATSNHTDIVHVMQHDVPIVRPFGVVELVASMRRSPPVRPMAVQTPGGTNLDVKVVEVGAEAGAEAESVYMVRYGMDTNVKTTTWAYTHTCFNRFTFANTAHPLYFSVRPFDVPRGTVMSASTSKYELEVRLPTDKINPNEEACGRPHASPPQATAHLLPDGMRLSPNFFYSDTSHFALRVLYERVIFPAVAHDKQGFMEEADVRLQGGRCAGPLYCGPLYDWAYYGAWYLGEDSDCFSLHLDGRSKADPVVPDWVTKRPS
jgi:hypothetical protein